jgi:hypothetical protein
MERHQHPVTGRAGIGLQVGVAQLDRVLEGGPGVLRRMGRPAPVREGDGARVLKERYDHDG